MKIARTLAYLVAAAAMSMSGWASANTLNITYLTISPNDPDINQECCGTYSNEVLSTLGPNGLPVLNLGYGGPTPNDRTAGNEITWWSPALNPHVTQTGTGTVTLPFDVPVNFFPPNGTGSSDANGYQAVILSGQLNVAGVDPVTVAFQIGADDSAFAYLDGQLVCSLGGVHGYSPGACVSPFAINPGAHDIKVFYDDLNAVQAGFLFDVTTQGVSTDPGGSVPEPGTLLLLGGAFAALFASRRR